MPAYAVTNPSPPDSTALVGVWAYKNVVETGDMVFLSYYNIYYSSTTPSQTSYETFIIRFMDGGTEITHAMPYPYFSLGYQQGVAIFYLDAATVIDGITRWNPASPYTFTLIPNPFVTWVGSTPALASSSVTWDNYTSMAASKIALGNRILASGLLLKSAWGVNMVEVKDGLNYYLTAPSSTSSGSGQEYFQMIFPQLKSACPQILEAQSTTAQYKTTAAVLTYAPDELPVDPTAGAAIFGMSKGVFSSLLAIVGVLMFTMYLISKRPEMARFVLFLDGVMVIFFTRTGNIVPIWATVIGTISLFIIGYMFFYERANA